MYMSRNMRTLLNCKRRKLFIAILNVLYPLP